MKLFDGCIKTFKIVKNGLFLFVVLFALSCNQSNSNSKRDEINARLSQLQNRTCTEESEYDRLIEDYKNLQTDIVNYTENANKNGESKNNDKTIADIEEKLTLLKVSKLRLKQLKLGGEMRKLKEPNWSNLDEVKRYRNSLVELQPKLIDLQTEFMKFHMDAEVVNESINVVNNEISRSDLILRN